MKVLIEEFSVLSQVHPGEAVYVVIRREEAFKPSRWFKGAFQVDLYVGAYCLARNYYGLTEIQAREVVIRYVLEQVDGISPSLN